MMVWISLIFLESHLSVVLSESTDFSILGTWVQMLGKANALQLYNPRHLNYLQYSRSAATTTPRNSRPKHNDIS